MAAYATAADVSTRLGRELSTAELAQVEAYIRDVSAHVTRFCRRSFPDPVPGDVLAIVCQEVIRTLNTDPGVSVEVEGDVRREYTGTTYTGLSRSAKDDLQSYRRKWASVQVVGTSWPEEPP